MAQALTVVSQAARRPGHPGRYWPLVVALLFTQIGPAEGHRLDECLQATRIDIGLKRVRIELDLTPGVQVAERILHTIDVDQDGRISPSEADSYADLVRSGLRLEMDGRPQVLRLEEQSFPSLAELREGVGTIRLRFGVRTSRARPGQHDLRFQNTHAEDHSVYLANALVPDEKRVTVTRQERDDLQKMLEIHFSVAATGKRLPRSIGSLQRR